MVTRLNWGPARAMIRRPVSVSPVKATRRTSGWPESASPMLAPVPVTTFSTPAGSPASCMSSATISAESGVVEAGLTTTVFPATSAGPIFVPMRVSG